jgi:hypothetical protein
MLQDHEDQSHETFWRQVLRWLVSSAKDPVTVEVAREVYAQNEPIQIRAEVNDEAFNRVNEAKVEATVSAPSGRESKISLNWSPQEEGVYIGEFFAVEDGLHTIDVAAISSSDTEAQKDFGLGQTHFLTLTGQAEFFDPVQKTEFLSRLAEQTGGRYYEISEVEDLPEEILYQESRATMTQVLDLWNMPINFILLLGLLASEWILRKRWGLN